MHFTERKFSIIIFTIFFQNVKKSNHKENRGKEKVKEIIAGRGFYYMPSAYISMKVTVEGVYEHEKMQQAVAFLEEAHPIINHVVHKDEAKMYFKDIGIHVPIIHYTDEVLVKWEDALLKLTTEPVNLMENPGVMICVVERTDHFFVLAIMHHMYGDGLSLKYLMDDLLYIYSVGHKLKEREAMTALCEEDLSAHAKIPQEIRDKYVSFAELCKNKQVEFSWEAYKQMIDTHNATVGTGITCRNIQGTMFRNLKGKCKELGVTINSALTTAMAAALQNNTGVEAIISMDTRSVFNHENNKGLANYASCIQTSINYDNSINFWDNVVIQDKRIKTEKTKTSKVLNTLYTFLLWGADVFGVGYYARYGMFRDMEVLMELRKALGLTTDTETFDISNIGSVDFTANCEDFVIKDCYFIPNPMPACASTFGVSSLDNVLTISLVHKKNIVSSEQAKKILHNVISYLVRNM